MATRVQVVGVLIRKRVNQDSIDCAEDDGGRADAQREGEDSEQCETAVLVEAAYGIAKILPNPAQEPVHAPPPRPGFPDIIHLDAWKSSAEP
jgi:hypothetical protein